jgi:exosortase A-associated hydrolase 2
MPLYPIDLNPFFLDSPRGPLFCLALMPIGVEPEGGVLYLPPFAEEMHKSRRMAALQARALAAQGNLVLQIDLTGCGDSAGDFGDASWCAWREDALLAHAWLTTKTTGPITLWGLRTGATLAVDISKNLTDIDHLLLWQPVTSGDVFLNQFLRIKLASEMLAEGQAQSGTKTLRAQLQQGEGIEVGGNMLSPDMARQLGILKLADITPACPVHWLEIGTETGSHLPPASQRIVDTWRTAGVTIDAETVAGDSFWATQEITECKALIHATARAYFRFGEEQQ